MSGTKEHQIDVQSQCIAIQTVIELEVIERLCSIGDGALKDQLAQLEAAMDRDIAGQDNNFQDAYFGHVNDEYIEIAETLPRLQSYSNYIIAYSLFEKSLNDVCRSVQVASGAVLSYKDISGQGISRARDYLVKVAGIVAPFETREWQEAKLSGELRNAIVHRSGFVDYAPDNKGSLYSRLGRAQDIELKQELADQTDALLFFGTSVIVQAIASYKIVLCEIAKLGRDFRSPKHGTPQNF